jgi:hypothetical protein
MHKFFLSFLFIFLLLFAGCPMNTVFTGKTYSGTLTTKDSSYSGSIYWDSYMLYSSGTWLLTLNSKDNVDIFLEGVDPVSRKLKINDLHAKSGSNSITVQLSGFTEIDICVNAGSTDWSNNGNNAGYYFSAVLR